MLETKDLSVYYGRHRAVDGASVSVDKGEIVVMLGANGAGKSTFLRAIAGLTPGMAGSSVIMDGHDITTNAPHDVVETGIALVPEGRGIFADLTVQENLMLGAYPRRARAWQNQNLDRVMDLFPKLGERRDQLVRTMSGGEQQMVAVGRAMMSNPTILMLDEPSLGLSPLLCSELFNSLAQIKQTGVGIFLVEQNAKQSLGIADRGYLLDNGHITQENTAAALANDPAVQQAYLGGDIRTGPQHEKIAIAMPPALPVPPSNALDLGHLAGDLAKRAAAIRSAYVRAARQAANLPSAFVGRYDKDADTASVLDFGPAHTGAVSQNTAKLSAMAASLANRAAELHADHIRTQRLAHQLPQTSTYAPSATPSPGPSELTSMAAQLATQAAKAHSAYVQEARTSAPIPSAFAKTTSKPVRKKPAANKTNNGGLNKKRAKTGAKKTKKIMPYPVKAANGNGKGLTLGELAAHAAQVHAAHVEAARAGGPVPSAFVEGRTKSVKAPMHKIKTTRKTNGAPAKPRAKPKGGKHG